MQRLQDAREPVARCSPRTIEYLSTAEMPIMPKVPVRATGHIITPAEMRHTRKIGYFRMWIGDQLTVVFINEFGCQNPDTSRSCRMRSVRLRLFAVFSRTCGI